MKTDKDIERLLERYMQGYTTPEEEMWLADHFARTEVKEEWKTYQEMFIFLGKMNRKGKQRTLRKRSKTILVLALTAAAMFLLLFTLWPREKKKPISQTTKQIAFALPTDSTVPEKIDTTSKKTNLEKAKQSMRSRNRHATPQPPKRYMAQIKEATPQEKVEWQVEQELMKLERQLATADKTIDLYILQQEYLTAQMIENEETEITYE
ncbi:MAG: hypothetical protein ACFN27_02890 [Prevotella sp.]